MWTSHVRGGGPTAAISAVNLAALYHARGDLTTARRWASLAAALCATAMSTGGAYSVADVTVV